MNVISPHALAVLAKALNHSSEMIFVSVKDETGHRYEGRMTSMQEVKGAPPASTFDIEATDGEMCWAVPVKRITAVDARPFQRFSGLSAAQFASDFATGQ